MLCRKLNLFANAFVAIDGSKFKAVNNRDRNFTKAKMKRRLQQIDESIERYLGQMASADRQESSEDKSQRLEDKIATLKKEMVRLKKLEVRMLEAPDQQISLTDPDARSMATSGRGTGMVGYNVQTAVDTTHHLIVAHEVTNVGHDRTQLAHMAEQAKEILETDELEVVADRGYFKGEEILACNEAGITTYLPKPQTSGSLSKGLFSKRDFIYRPADDKYECPAGERLIYRFTRQEKGKAIRRYWSSVCPRCEAVQERLDREPERMRARRETAEHPYGTIKSWMGSTHFLTRGLSSVSTEMSLHVMAYNLKRMMNIFGVKPLIEAIQT
jgi:hypothetical protein